MKAMTEEKLSAFIDAVKGDAGLQEKIKVAADIDAVMAIAKEAGFDVSKADWIKHQARQSGELRDEELEGIAGGRSSAIGEGTACGEAITKVINPGYCNEITMSHHPEFPQC